MMQESCSKTLAQQESSSYPTGSLYPGNVQRAGQSGGSGEIFDELRQHRARASTVSKVPSKVGDSGPHSHNDSLLRCEPHAHAAGQIRCESH